MALAPLILVLAHMRAGSPKEESGLELPWLQLAMQAFQAGLLWFLEYMATVGDIDPACLHTYIYIYILQYTTNLENIVAKFIWDAGFLSSTVRGGYGA